MPPSPWSTLDTGLIVAVQNAGFSQGIKSWYETQLPLKDGTLYRVEGRLVTTLDGEHLNPPWETLFLWWGKKDLIAAREWKPRRGQRELGIFKVAPVITVRDAMDLWGWTPAAYEMAAKLKCDVGKPR